ncbi:Hypothetical protein SRAE_1000269800 [Strongyloides ratti]|uniref:Uncharacterized protein n=1 Tax=Strongyloides ratti TaxID=34506 RepID=A0A090MWX5_STRRB|nr:Hypothetical protein SRAE_1000269800 [Strongyloides ratti]CEF64444.1 Hypothetical protein SRAE_1000269800 [Strongyloides ratti]
MNEVMDIQNNEDHLNKINYTALYETFFKGNDNIENYNFWYQKLINFNLSENESYENISIIIRAMQYIIQYEHTVAEELKEISEKEAVEMAEKEENWEQERQIYAEELSNLREKITNDAGYDDLTEAFRDEINTLKEENNHLKQIGRDRDRELADQREKEENLIMKISNLEKDKNMKTYQLAQYEDTIKELNRKVSRKDDSNQKNEWEVKKLRQRNEQALKLSTQLEDVMEQNNKLKKEVERVTTALEDATELINETTEKYNTLTKQMTEAEVNISHLVEENNLLQRQLKEKHNDLQELLTQDEITGKELNSLVKKKDSTIERLNNEIQILQNEIEQYKRITESGNLKKDYEEEMEVLKEELIAATKIAKALFGSSEKTGNNDEDPTAGLRVRLIQMDKKLEKSNEDNKLLIKEKKNLEDLIVEKEEANIKLYKEIDRLRKAAFGDGDSEVKRLEEQIKFRDNQIAKLIQKISLMEIHLSEMEVNKENDNVINDKQIQEDNIDNIDNNNINRVKRKHKRRMKLQRSKSIDDKNIILSPSSNYYEEKTYEKNYSSLEASALLITSLNGEIIRLLEELEDKDNELIKLNKLYKNQENIIDEMNTKLLKIEKSENSTKLVKDEIDTIKRECSEKVENISLELEKQKISNQELKRILSSINLDEDEKIRRLSESSRRLVYVEIQNANIRREKRILEDKVETYKLLVEKKENKIKCLGKNSEERIQEIMFQNELNVIEIARLQNNLINSVPQFEYERVVEKYKNLMLQFFNITGENKENINETAFTRIDILNNNINDNLTKEQLNAEVKMLRNLNEVISNQSDYWQKEVEKLKIECNEINDFLEAFRSASDLQDFIGAIQRKFVNCLTSQQETKDDRMMLERKLKKLYIDSKKAEKEWRNDRQKLVDGIMHLKRLLEREKSKNFYSISVDEIAMLKEKMDIIEENKNEIKKNLEEIENEKYKLKLLTNNLEAMQDSIKELSSKDSNILNYQKIIQAHILNNMTLNNNIKSLNRKLETKEKELNEIKHINEDLENLNKDLYLLTVKPLEITPIQTIDFKVYENLFKNSENLKKIDKIDDNIDDTTSIKSEDIYINNKDNHDNIKTIIIDNSDDYEREIQSIKKTAHIAIEGYKNQVKQKNKSIEEYKELVQKMIIEVQNMDNNFNEKIKLIKESNKKMVENSSNITSKETTPDISQNNLYIKLQETLNLKEKECVKHISELKELEEAYLDLTNKYKNNEKNVCDVGLQTSIDDNTFKKDSTIMSDKSSSNSESSNKINETVDITINDDNKTTNRSNSSSSVVSSSSSGASSLSNNNEVEKQSIKSSNIDVKSITSTREDMLILQQKNEIRRLRTKVINMERRNKELENENTAISEKLSKYTRKTTCDLSNNLDVENQTLKTEITKLRREAVTMRKRIENLNKQVFELEKSNKTKIRSENTSVERWKEKKTFDSTINILKRQLAESKKEQKELQERIERRDRLIEQLHEEKGSLRVEAAMKRAKNIENRTAIVKSEANILENKLRDEMTLQQARIDTLKEKLTMLHNENIYLKKKVSKLEKEIIEQKEMFEKSKDVVENENKMVVFEVDDKYTNNKNAIPEIIIQEDSGYETTYRNHSSDNEEKKMLRKELRMVEIKCVELTEQVTKLRLELLEYQENYNILKRKYEDRMTQDNQLASVIILKDKIEAKERLISIQRQKIEDLEKELWERNNQRTFEVHSDVFY